MSNDSIERLKQMQEAENICEVLHDALTNIALFAGTALDNSTVLTRAGNISDQIYWLHELRDIFQSSVQSKN